MGNHHEQSLRRGGSFELTLERLTKVFQAADGHEVAAVDHLSLRVTAGTFLTWRPVGLQQDHDAPDDRRPGARHRARSVGGRPSPTSPEPPQHRLVFQSYALFPPPLGVRRVAYPQVKKRARPSDARWTGLGLLD
jgi:hypothetical protein